MTVDIVFSGLLVYLLVFARLAGMILFNPLLSRNNVPRQVRTGLTLFMALLLAPLQPAEIVAAANAMSGIGYAFTVVRELAIGMVFGYVFQIFYYFLFFAGDIIDTDIGVSMAKTFDPNTSIQAGFNSQLLTILFSLYVFVSNSHLALLQIFADTFTAIPAGSFTLSVSLLDFLISMVSQVFLIALRLAAPFMVAEVVLQMCLGILMKFVPQITVFIINFQLKILLGLLMLYVFAYFIGNFIDSYIVDMFSALRSVTGAILSGSAA